MVIVPGHPMGKANRALRTNDYADCVAAHQWNRFVRLYRAELSLAPPFGWTTFQRAENPFGLGVACCVSLHT
jgi:hypothetical protein